MESGASGHYTDYSDTRTSPPTGKPAGQTPPSSADRCDQAIPDLDLEEVANSEYFQARGTLPAMEAPVGLRKELVDGRLAIIDSASAQILGFLPTKYNYLRACMAKGRSYVGAVRAADVRPIPRVRIDLAPL